MLFFFVGFDRSCVSIVVGWLNLFGLVWVGGVTYIFFHALVVRMVAKFLNKPSVKHQLMYNNLHATQHGTHLKDPFDLKLHRY